jgi:hypothetical protein
MDLKWCPKRLRGDRDIVLEAVKKNYRALEDASAALRADREVALEAERTASLSQQSL